MHSRLLIRAPYIIKTKMKKSIQFIVLTCVVSWAIAGIVPIIYTLITLGIKEKPFTKAIGEY